MQRSIIDEVIESHATAEMEGQFNVDTVELRTRLNGISNHRQELLEGRAVEDWDRLQNAMRDLRTAYVMFFVPLEMAGYVKAILAAPKQVAESRLHSKDRWTEMGRELQELQEKQSQLSDVVNETHGIAVSARARVTQLEDSVSALQEDADAGQMAATDLVNANG